MSTLESEITKIAAHVRSVSRGEFGYDVLTQQSVEDALRQDFLSNGGKLPSEDDVYKIVSPEDDEDIDVKDVFPNTYALLESFF